MSSLQIRGPRSRSLRSLLGVASAAVVVVCGRPADARAQDRTQASDSTTARIAVVRGRIVDARTNAPISGAEVTLTRTATVAGAQVTIVGNAAIAVTTRSDDRGEWRSPALPLGRYVLNVRSLGYAARRMAIDAASPEHTVQTIALDPVGLALDQVVVTASRREQRLRDVVTTTELVTRDDIERTGASDLASVLLEQTGIELQGGHPAGTGLMLQGLGSERVLVLLDGHPLVGRIDGVFDVSRVPLSVVERIEVVKGPQSTLYGSEAMGGVVNIITRQPPTAAVTATATALAGNNGRREGSVGIAAGRGPLAASIDVSHRTIDATPGRAEVVGALAVRTDVAGKLRWLRDSTLRLEAGVLALDERQRWRTGSFYNFGDNVQWSATVGGDWQNGRHRVASSLFASVFDHLSRGSTEPEPIAGDEGQRQLQRLYQAELFYDLRVGTDLAHALRLGTHLRRDETETARVSNGIRSLNTVEPFAELDLALTPSLTVVPGMRVSVNRQWGTHATPRLAARLHASDRLTLRGSVGAGYRAPDFKELYMFFQNTAAGYAVLGSADLRPERSRNATVGAEWTHVGSYLRGQLYWNEFSDFIETRPISGPGEPPVFQYANVDDGFTRGVEIEAGVSVRTLNLEVGYAGLDTRDDGSGEPLLGRPTHAARATVGYDLFTGTHANVTGVYTGRTPMQRDATTGAVTSWRDGFLRVDVRLAQPIRDGLELVVGADNLFDRQPAEWAGFTARHTYVALSWTFDPEGR